ncbi:hypothetical protein VFPFJ_07190 [Purpureocillium lilacinum]|uniref:Uncharacterized protein n=1 Tax=Purpureocillium lilacinum TaxID=33203 RepID=A0A179HEN5_PURLI|nr:hypothetical protein VFPFJ_07190 [Purpureocillium lilacinum]OAQ88725.1 hypothetical protein VFPFJ_07190 [Purpureocillium lilacinum]
MEAFFFNFSLGSARETTALDETTAARPTLGPGTWLGGQGMALLPNLQFIHPFIHQSIPSPRRHGAPPALRSCERQAGVPVPSLQGRARHGSGLHAPLAKASNASCQ